MSGTIVRRRVVGFVKAKSKGRTKSAGPRKSTPPPQDNDRMVGEVSRATPLMAHPAHREASESRGAVWLAAAAVLVLAIGGGVLVMSATEAPKDSPSVSSPRSGIKAATRRTDPRYGAYPDSADSGVPSGDRQATNEEGFLAAAYVRRKPQVSGEVTSGTASGHGTSAKAANPSPSPDCVVGGEGSGRDIGDCLRRLGATSPR